MAHYYDFEDRSNLEFLSPPPFISYHFYLIPLPITICYKTNKRTYIYIMIKLKFLELLQFRFDRKCLLFGFFGIKPFGDFYADYTF